MNQTDRILEALATAPPEGLTLEEIHTLSDVPAATVSAAIRNMRKRGAAQILSIPAPGGVGPWTYKLEAAS